MHARNGAEMNHGRMYIESKILVGNEKFGEYASRNNQNIFEMYA